MNPKHKPPAFTIVELMVVIGIIAVVLGLSYSAYSHAVRLGQQTQCVSNLRQIAVGLNVYFNEYGHLPSDRPGGFEAGLVPVLETDTILHCPADRQPGASSYAPYYVERRELEGANFVIGCPRHADGAVATVLYGNAAAEGSVMGKVTHNGAPVSVGDRLTGGTIRFGDGSTAALNAGLSVDVVAAFERGDGSYYMVVRVPLGEVGTLGLDVNPNSRLEVVTPAAIAGSEGTVYYVTVLDPSGAAAAKVYVFDGQVRVTGKGPRASERVLVKQEAAAVAESGLVSSTTMTWQNTWPVLPGAPAQPMP